MNGPGIKVKFTFWYLTVLSVVLIALGTGIYITLSRQLYTSFNNSLKERVDQISKFREIISIVAGGSFEGEPGELISFYFYFDDELVNISHRQVEIPVEEGFIKTVLYGGNVYKTVQINDESFKIYAVPYSPEKERIRLDKFRVGRKYGPGRESLRFRNLGLPNQIEIGNAVLMVARSTTNIDKVLKQLLQILIFAFPITLFLSGWGGVFLLNRILSPIDQISQTTRRISETDLTKRIKVKTDDELGYLAQTINLMLARLEKAFQRQKDLTSDASHELRAPLAVIQAEASLSLQKKRNADAYRESMEIIANTTERMSGIIKQILFLARSDSGRQTVPFKSLNLNGLLSELCDEMDILCKEKGLKMSYVAVDNIDTTGNEQLLRNLFLNLISNAVRYTPADGDIKITLSLEKGMAKVEICDTGIGIPSEDLPHIFERFYRVDKARSRESGGSGLGLSIADQIVTAHKGEISVISELYKGSTFIVKLPLIS